MKKKTYSKDIEAAWYALKNFIHPLDCSYKGEYPITDPDGQVKEIKYGVYPLNRNYVLASVLSGSSIFRPSYFSKSKLNQHLTRQDTYYYRSKYDGIHTEGYGSSEKQALNLEFSDDLGIISPRKKYEGKYYILLLGIDIDTHNGEPDAIEVENWLRSDYFPESYWEPSSGLKGRHGYVKVGIPCNIYLSDVISTFEEIFKYLDDFRKQKNYQAPIDPPCGLPSQVKFVNTNPYIEEMNEVIKNNPSLHVDNSSFSINDKFIKIHRSQALKIPRFNETDKSMINISDIICFHNLQFYKFSYCKKMLRNLRQQLNINNSGKKKDNITEIEIPLTIVCSPPENTKLNKGSKEVKWIEISDISRDISDYWKSNKKNDNRKTYASVIEELKTEQDTMKKTREFYWNYSLYLKNVPTPQEAIDEYISQGLNSNSDIDSKKRLSRFKSCYKFISQRFDQSKLGFHMEDWDACKSKYMYIVESNIAPDIDMKWTKDKKKYYNLKTEELALIYYAILKSNELDHKSNRIIKNSFSYKRIQEIFNVVYGKGCHRAKCNKILQVLQTIKLVNKTGNHIAGIRGNCYVAKAV